MYHECDAILIIFGLNCVNALFLSYKPLFNQVTPLRIGKGINVLIIGLYCFTWRRKRVPHIKILTFGNTKKSQGARSGEYGGWLSNLTGVSGFTYWMSTCIIVIYKPRSPDFRPYPQRFWKTSGRQTVQHRRRTHPATRLIPGPT